MNIPLTNVWLQRRTVEAIKFGMIVFGSLMAFAMSAAISAV